MRRNEKGIHETKHYNLGRGILYIAELSGSDMSPNNGFQDVGNLTEFTVSIDTDELEHKSTREEISLTDVNIITNRELKVSFKSDSITGNNLSKFFSTMNDKLPNFVALGNVINTIDIQDPSSIGGRWYEIKSYQGGAPYNIFNCTAITVSGGVEGTDFIEDTTNCRFFVPKDSGLTAGNHTCTATQNAGAKANVGTVFAFQNTSTKYGLKFISANPNESDSDYKSAQWEFFQVDLRPTESIALVGDDWAEVPFEGTCEVVGDASFYASELSQLMRVVSAAEA